MTHYYYFKDSDTMDRCADALEKLQSVTGVNFENGGCIAIDIDSFESDGTEAFKVVESFGGWE